MAVGPPDHLDARPAVLGDCRWRSVGFEGERDVRVSPRMRTERAYVGFTPDGPPCLLVVGVVPRLLLVAGLVEDPVSTARFRPQEIDEDPRNLNGTPAVGGLDLSDFSSMDLETDRCSTFAQINRTPAHGEHFSNAAPSRVLKEADSVYVRVLCLSGGEQRFHLLNAPGVDAPSFFIELGNPESANCSSGDLHEVP